MVSIWSLRPLRQPPKANLGVPSLLLPLWVTTPGYDLLRLVHLSSATIPAVAGPRLIRLKIAVGSYEGPKVAVKDCEILASR